MNIPKTSFGIIVLNGEPFARYNLKALYPFAHQIIVVEGAVPGAASIADEKGHSTDGTLETLIRFKEEEDPEDKLIIVTAEDEGYPDGFWPGEKDEQSQAYAKRATGEYLWQVDIDEFYKPEDMETLLKMLKEDPSITAVSFPMLTFWGSPDYIADGWYLRRGARIYHRVFKWGPGYRYVTHRPPTVHDPDGRDLRSIKWIKGKDLEKKGIYLYHYSLLFPRQVLDKCTYYLHADWAKRHRAISWARECFLSLKNPFRVHNVYDYPSWLERFEGTHPPQVMAMMKDIKEGRLKIEMRPTQDIENLLQSSSYAAKRTLLRIGSYVDKGIFQVRDMTKRALGKVVKLA